MLGRKAAPFGWALPESQGKCSGWEMSSEEQWGTADMKGPRLENGVAARGSADHAHTSLGSSAVRRILASA